MNTIATFYSLIHLGSLSTLEGLFFFFWSCNFLFSSSIFQHKYSFVIWIFVIPRRFVSYVLCCWLFFYLIRQIFSPFLWLRILRFWQCHWVFSYKQTFPPPSFLCWTLFLQVKHITKGWTCLRMVFPLVIGHANIMLSRPQYCLSERYSTLLFPSSTYCSLFDIFFVYQFNSLFDLHSVSVMYAPGSKHIVFSVYCFVLCALYSVQYIKYFFNNCQCQISLCETSYESSCIRIYSSERMMKLFCLINWQRIPQSFSVTDTPAKLCRAWYKFWREELCEEN